MIILKMFFVKYEKKRAHTIMLIVYSTHLNNIKLLKILDKGR